MGNKQNKVINEQPTISDFWMLNPPQSLHKSFFKSNKYLWVDSNIDSLENKKYLRQIKKNYDIRSCKSISQATQIIRSQSLKLFRIIISAELAQNFCKQLVKDENIAHIYIFCKHLQEGQRIKNRFNKIKVVTNDFTRLLLHMEALANEGNKFKIFPTFAKINQDRTIVNKLRYNLHGLLLCQNTNQAKLDFILLAEQIYKNQKETHIKKFKNNYLLHAGVQQTLKWYTKQCFFYKLLNNLLRVTYNPLELAYIRLPFRNVFNSIRTIYKTNSTREQQFDTYRGGWISDQDLRFLKQNEGKLIEILGFMSTTKDKQTINKFRKNIVFTIKIKNKKRASQLDYGYADIAKYSTNKYENEVLFNALNVFKIQKIQYSNGIHHIILNYGQLAFIYQKHLDGLKLSAQQHIQICNYEHQKQKIGYIKTQGNILNQCEQYEQALKYYFSYLSIIKNNKIPKHKLEATMHYEIARNYHSKGDYDKAIQSYNKFISIHLEKFNQNSLWLASAYNNMGILYDIKNNYTQAILYYKRSLEIKLKILGKNHVSLAVTYNNIGAIYYTRCQYNATLSYYYKSLKIYQANYGQSNEAIGTMYNNIAEVYKANKLFDSALGYYQKSLKIYQNTIGQNHSSTASTYNNIGEIFTAKKQYTNALKFFQRSLKIKLKILSYNHELTAITYNNISMVWKAQANYDQALEYIYKCLNIQIIRMGIHHPSIAIVYNNIGVIYASMKQYEKALEYFSKALQISLNNSVNSNTLTQSIYLNIGSIWEQKSQLHIALMYYQKIFKLESSNIPIQIYDKMGKIFLKIHEYKKSLEYYKKSGQIYENKKDYDKAFISYDKCIQIKLLMRTK